LDITTYALLTYGQKINKNRWRKNSLQKWRLPVWCGWRLPKSSTLCFTQV